MCQTPSDSQTVLFSYSDRTSVHTVFEATGTQKAGTLMILVRKKMFFLTHSGYRADCLILVESEGYKTVYDFWGNKITEEIDSIFNARQGFLFFGMKEKI